MKAWADLTLQDGRDKESRTLQAGSCSVRMPSSRSKRSSFNMPSAQMYRSTHLQVYGTSPSRTRTRGPQSALGPPAKTPCVESLVAHCVKDTIDSISEEVLGIDRKLPEATRSESRCESASRPCQTSLGQRSRQIATAIERLRTKVVAGKLLCTVHYGRIRRSTPNIWEETQRERTSVRAPYCPVSAAKARESQ